jgi:hypothetical protein
LLVEPAYAVIRIDILSNYRFGKCALMDFSGKRLSIDARTRGDHFGREGSGRAQFIFLFSLTFSCQAEAIYSP